MPQEEDASNREDAQSCLLISNVENGKSKLCKVHIRENEFKNLSGV